MTGKHLVLIGLMGAGKTSVGRECARRLHRDFVDTDELISCSQSLSVEGIFAMHGEEHFRDLERTTVEGVCASPAPLVVACGGGTVVDPGNRRALRAAGFVVWLRAPAATLSKRVGDGSRRPLLRGDPPAALARLEALRGPSYEGAAHASVDTDGLDIAAVADAVLALYAGVSR